jgi:hypothetical protein
MDTCSIPVAYQQHSAGKSPIVPTRTIIFPNALTEYHRPFLPDLSASDVLLWMEALGSDDPSRDPLAASVRPPVLSFALVRYETIQVCYHHLLHWVHLGPVYHIVGSARLVCPSPGILQLGRLPIHASWIIEGHTFALLCTVKLAILLLALCRCWRI